MFNHRMEIVNNHGNGYRDWLFYQNIFLRECQLPQWLSMAKDSQLRDYLEVYSSFPLSSIKNFFKVH